MKNLSHSSSCRFSSTPFLLTVETKVDMRLKKAKFESIILAIKATKLKAFDTGVFCFSVFDIFSKSNLFLVQNFDDDFSGYSNTLFVF